MLAYDNIQKKVLVGFETILNLLRQGNIGDHNDFKLSVFEVVRLASIIGSSDMNDLLCDLSLILCEFMSKMLDDHDLLTLLVEVLYEVIIHVRRDPCTSIISPNSPIVFSSNSLAEFPPMNSKIFPHVNNSPIGVPKNVKKCLENDDLNTIEMFPPHHFVWGLYASVERLIDRIHPELLSLLAPEFPLYGSFNSKTAENQTFLSISQQLLNTSTNLPSPNTNQKFPDLIPSSLRRQLCALARISHALHALFPISKSVELTQRHFLFISSLVDGTNQFRNLVRNIAASHSELKFKGGFILMQLARCMHRLVFIAGNEVTKENVDRYPSYMMKRLLIKTPTTSPTANISGNLNSDFLNRKGGNNEISNSSPSTIEVLNINLLSRSQNNTSSDKKRDYVGSNFHPSPSTQGTENNIPAHILNNEKFVIKGRCTLRHCDTDGRTIKEGDVEKYNSFASETSGGECGNVFVSFDKKSNPSIILSTVLTQLDMRRQKEQGLFSVHFNSAESTLKLQNNNIGNENSNKLQKQIDFEITKNSNIFKYESFGNFSHLHPSWASIIRLVPLQEFSTSINHFERSQTLSSPSTMINGKPLNTNNSSNFIFPKISKFSYIDVFALIQPSTPRFFWSWIAIPNKMSTDVNNQNVIKYNSTFNHKLCTNDRIPDHLHTKGSSHSFRRQISPIESNLNVNLDGVATINQSNSECSSISYTNKNSLGISVQSGLLTDWVRNALYSTEFDKYADIFFCMNSAPLSFMSSSSSSFNHSQDSPTSVSSFDNNFTHPSTIPPLKNNSNQRSSSRALINNIHYRNSNQSMFFESFSFSIYYNVAHGDIYTLNDFKFSNSMHSQSFPTEVSLLSPKFIGLFNSSMVSSQSILRVYLDALIYLIRKAFLKLFYSAKLRIQKPPKNELLDDILHKNDTKLGKDDRNLRPSVLFNMKYQTNSKVNKKLNINSDSIPNHKNGNGDDGIHDSSITTRNKKSQGNNAESFRSHDMDNISINSEISLLDDNNSDDLALYEEFSTALSRIFDASSAFRWNSHQGINTNVDSHLKRVYHDTLKQVSNLINEGTALFAPRNVFHPGSAAERTVFDLLALSFRLKKPSKLQKMIHCAIKGELVKNAHGSSHCLTTGHAERLTSALFASSYIEPQNVSIEGTIVTNGGDHGRHHSSWLADGLLHGEIDYLTTKHEEHSALRLFFSSMGLNLQVLHLNEGDIDHDHDQINQQLLQQQHMLGKRGKRNDVNFDSDGHQIGAHVGSPEDFWQDLGPLGGVQAGFPSFQGQVSSKLGLVSLMESSALQLGGLGPAWVDRSIVPGCEILESSAVWAERRMTGNWKIPKSIRTLNWMTRIRNNSQQSDDGRLRDLNLGSLWNLWWISQRPFLKSFLIDSATNDLIDVLVTKPLSAEAKHLRKINASTQQDWIYKLGFDPFDGLTSGKVSSRRNMKALNGAISSGFDNNDNQLNFSIHQNVNDMDGRDVGRTTPSVLKQKSIKNSTVAFQPTASPILNSSSPRVPLDSSNNLNQSTLSFAASTATATPVSSSRSKNPIFTVASALIANKSRDKHSNRLAWLQQHLQNDELVNSMSRTGYDAINSVYKAVSDREAEIRNITGATKSDNIEKTVVEGLKRQIENHLSMILRLVEGIGGLNDSDYVLFRRPGLIAHSDYGLHAQSSSISKKPSAALVQPHVITSREKHFVCHWEENEVIAKTALNFSKQNVSDWNNKHFDSGPEVAMREDSFSPPGNNKFDSQITSQKLSMNDVEFSISNFNDVMTEKSHLSDVDDEDAEIENISLMMNAAAANSHKRPGSHHKSKRPGQLKINGGASSSFHKGSGNLNLLNDVGQAEMRHDTEYLQWFKSKLKNLIENNLVLEFDQCDGAWDGLFRQVLPGWAERETNQFKMIHDIWGMDSFHQFLSTMMVNWYVLSVYRRIDDAENKETDAAFELDILNEQNTSKQTKLRRNHRISKIGEQSIFASILGPFSAPVTLQRILSTFESFLPRDTIKQCTAVGFVYRNIFKNFITDVTSVSRTIALCAPNSVIEARLPSKETLFANSNSKFVDVAINTLVNGTTVISKEPKLFSSSFKIINPFKSSNQNKSSDEKETAMINTIVSEIQEILNHFKIFSSSYLSYVSSYAFPIESNRIQIIRNCLEDINLEATGVSFWEKAIEIASIWGYDIINADVSGIITQRIHDILDLSTEVIWNKPVEHNHLYKQHQKLSDLVLDCLENKSSYPCFIEDYKHFNGMNVAQLDEQMTLIMVLLQFATSEPGWKGDTKKLEVSMSANRKNTSDGSSYQGNNKNSKDVAASSPNETSSQDESNSLSSFLNSVKAAETLWNCLAKPASDLLLDIRPGSSEESEPLRLLAVPHAVSILSILSAASVKHSSGAAVILKFIQNVPSFTPRLINLLISPQVTTGALRPKVTAHSLNLLCSLAKACELRYGLSCHLLVVACLLSHVTTSHLQNSDALVVSGRNSPSKDSDDRTSKSSAQFLLLDENDYVTFPISVRSPICRTERFKYETVWAFPIAADDFMMHNSQQLRLLIDVFLQLCSDPISAPYASKLLALLTKQSSNVNGVRGNPSPGLNSSLLSHVKSDSTNMKEGLQNSSSIPKDTFNQQHNSNFVNSSNFCEDGGILHHALASLPFQYSTAPPPPPRSFWDQYNPLTARDKVNELSYIGRPADGSPIHRKSMAEVGEASTVTAPEFSSGLRNFSPNKIITQVGTENLVNPHQIGAYLDTESELDCFDSALSNSFQNNFFSASPTDFCPSLVVIARQIALYTSAGLGVHQLPPIGDMDNQSVSECIKNLLSVVANIANTPNEPYPVPAAASPSQKPQLLKSAPPSNAFMSLPSLTSPIIEVNHINIQPQLVVPPIKQKVNFSPSKENVPNVIPDDLSLRHWVDVSSPCHPRIALSHSSHSSRSVVADTPSHLAEVFFDAKNVHSFPTVTLDSTAVTTPLIKTPPRNHQLSTNELSTYSPQSNPTAASFEIKKTTPTRLAAPPAFRSKQITFPSANPSSSSDLKEGGQTGSIDPLRDMMLLQKLQNPTRAVADLRKDFIKLLIQNATTSLDSPNNNNNNENSTTTSPNTATMNRGSQGGGDVQQAAFLLISPLARTNTLQETPRTSPYLPVSSDIIWSPEGNRTIQLLRQSSLVTSRSKTLQSSRDDGTHSNSPISPHVSPSSFGNSRHLVVHTNNLASVVELAWVGLIFLSDASDILEWSNAVQVILRIIDESIIQLPCVSSKRFSSILPKIPEGILRLVKCMPSVTTSSSKSQPKYLPTSLPHAIHQLFRKSSHPQISSPHNKNSTDLTTNKVQSHGLVLDCLPLILLQWRCLIAQSFVQLLLNPELNLLPHLITHPLLSALIPSSKAYKPIPPHELRIITHSMNLALFPILESSPIKSVFDSWASVDYPSPILSSASPGFNGSCKSTQHNSAQQVFKQELHQLVHDFSLSILSERHAAIRSIVSLLYTTMSGLFALSSEVLHFIYLSKTNSSLRSRQLKVGVLRELEKWEKYLINHWDPVGESSLETAHHDADVPPVVHASHRDFAARFVEASGRDENLACFEGSSSNALSTLSAFIGKARGDLTPASNGPTPKSDATQPGVIFSRIGQSYGPLKRLDTINSGGEADDDDEVEDEDLDRNENAFLSTSSSLNASFINTENQETLKLIIQENETSTIEEEPLPGFYDNESNLLSNQNSPKLQQKKSYSSFLFSPSEMRDASAIKCSPELLESLRDIFRHLLRILNKSIQHLCASDLYAIFEDCSTCLPSNICVNWCTNTIIRSISEFLSLSPNATIFDIGLSANDVMNLIEVHRVFSLYLLEIGREEDILADFVLLKDALPRFETLYGKSVSNSILLTMRCIVRNSTNMGSNQALGATLSTRCNIFTPISSFLEELKRNGHVFDDEESLPKLNPSSVEFYKFIEKKKTNLLGKKSRSESQGKCNCVIM